MSLSHEPGSPANPLIATNIGVPTATAPAASKSTIGSTAEVEHAKVCVLEAGGTYPVGPTPDAGGSGACTPPGEVITPENMNEQLVIATLTTNPKIRMAAT